MALHFSSVEQLSTLYDVRNAQIVNLCIRAHVSLANSSPLDPDKPERLLQRFIREVSLDFRGVTARYSALADELMQTCVSTSDSTITGEFLNGMKDTPIFREYLHFYRTGDVSCLKFILSFLCFAKKLDVDFDDLRSTAFRAWEQIERELAAAVFDNGDLAVLRDAVSSLINVEHFNDNLVLPKHGSGQVSEGVSTFQQKFDHLTWDGKLQRCFRVNRFGKHCDQRGNLPVREDRGEPKRSKYWEVPKNYKTTRSIMMEPAAYMYFQQEVLRWLLDCMDRSPIAQIVDLRDQAMNREYALWGSIHQTLDTIDLSAASDRVHVDIVKAVFPAKILYYLLGTRSSTVVLPDGRTTTVKKFAPMGSALCFPVQCILFAAITIIGYTMAAQACTLEDLRGNSDRINLFRRVLRGLSRDHTRYSRSHVAPRVYGDDIICDTRVTTDVIHLLNHFGLKVNVDKSFTGGQMVRESCGIYAYQGEDITPFLLRVKRWDTVLTTATYASAVEAINNCGDHGYRELHGMLIRWLKEVAPTRNCALPFVVDRTQFGIWTKQKLAPDPAYVRENKSWQLLEERVLLVRSVEPETVKSEDYLYDQWMRSKIRPRSDAESLASGRIRPRHTRFAAGWTPLRV